MMEEEAINQIGELYKNLINVMMSMPKVTNPEKSNLENLYYMQLPMPIGYSQKFYDKWLKKK